jgi:hypothetical protein
LTASLLKQPKTGGGFSILSNLDAGRMLLFPALDFNFIIQLAAHS